MKEADDLLEDVVARLRETPLGQAPIDRAIERLAREVKLKKVGLYKLTLVQVRQRVIRAWWWARFITDPQRKKECGGTFASIRIYRKRLSELRLSLINLRCEHRRSGRSPLEYFAAMGDLAAAELIDDLRASVMATQQAARRVSKVLGVMQRNYETRGRSRSMPIAFAQSLAPLWHELTGKPPGVTHRNLDEIWIGQFVDFIEAAAATVDLPELSGNFPVAADKAAQWYRRRLRRQKGAAAPQK